MGSVYSLVKHNTMPDSISDISDARFFNISRGSNYENNIYTLMANNSTNINKTNNNLNLLTEHKKTTTLDVGSPGPGLKQAQECDRVKPANGISNLPC
jgi:hypothetical protein